MPPHAITATPGDAISRLNAAAGKIVTPEEFWARFANNGAKAESSTPEGRAELVKFHAGVTRKLFAPLTIEIQQRQVVKQCPHERGHPAFQPGVSSPETGIHGSSAKGRATACMD